MAEYNESQINSNETERISAEQERIENEAKRQTNETEREARETTRQSNETTRISKEAERLAEEVNRVEAETSRVNAEQGRVEAENIRAEFYEGFNDRLDTVDSQLAHNENELKLLKNANNVYGINIPEYSDIGLILNDIIQNTNVPVIYIPSGTYNSSVEITIDRPVKIIGENSWYTEDETGVHSLMPYISFSSSKGFNITVPNVRIENVSVRAVDYGFFAEYYKNGRITSTYNIQLENCTSEHCIEADFYIGMTVQCEIKHCVALGGKTGFRFEGGQNTSTLIENCWARNVQNEGYYCASMTYCTFINCCCDIAKTGFIVSSCKSVNFIGCGSELVEDVFHLTSCIGVTIIEPFGAFNGGTESNPLNEKGSLINVWVSKDITITGGNNIEYNGNYDITSHAMIDGDVPILLGGSDLRVNFFKANNAIKQGDLLKYMSIEGGAGGKSYYVPSVYAKYKVIYTIFINGTVEQTISTTMDGGSLVFDLPVGRTCQIIYIPLA